MTTIYGEFDVKLDNPCASFIDHLRVALGALSYHTTPGGRQIAMQDIQVVPTLWSGQGERPPRRAVAVFDVAGEQPEQTLMAALEFVIPDAFARLRATDEQQITFREITKVIQTPAETVAPDPEPAADATADALLRQLALAREALADARYADVERLLAWATQSAATLRATTNSM